MSTHQPSEPATTSGPLAGFTGAPLPRGVTVLIGVIGVVILGTGIRGAAGIVAPTMLALVLTIAVLPIGSWARGHGWPSWLATLLALVAAYAILLVLLVGTIICLVKLVDLLPQYTKDAQGLTDQAAGLADRSRTRQRADERRPEEGRPRQGRRPRWPASSRASSGRSVACSSW